ncbi:hypothetical protein KY290_021419 [Solanum tuberosum]|uniref:Retrotransposon gag domain-containing protein n=1 Tax=Solanum tuberosum TaxID=4113 RepID=A0ABQ7V3I0_SOLTU|nr:hypothetical protein KY289_020584 [Solanum tuberosum]KAH0693240.1 hypothetical protein KY285_020337 [Solanum tuberosum]KAH0757926.1 hypothetical protein KY290_021419 [Solanum tuberosum]
MAPTSSTSNPIIESTPATLSAGNNPRNVPDLQTEPKEVTATTNHSPKKGYDELESSHKKGEVDLGALAKTNPILAITFSISGWRRAVIIALSAKNKLGFTDGSLAIPIADLALQKAWSHCNDIVLLWFLNSLSKEIVESVFYSQSAKELWSDLENRFGQTNGAKLFQLQKELNAVVQGNSSTSGYFTKMKSLWDELDAFIPWLSKMKVYLGDSTSFIVATQLGGNRNYYSFKPPKGSVESKKNSSTCAYCKKAGHSIDKCYRIHGFPPDFKFTKQRKFQTLANNAYHVVEEVDQGGNGFSNVKTLTRENMGELLQLLQQFKLGQQSDNNAEATTSANCADINSWILDSGASEHMTLNKHLLSNFKSLGNPIMVTLPNSHKVKVTHCGSVTLLPNLILHNVPIMVTLPNSHKVKLCKQLNQHVLFTPDSCFLPGPSVKGHWRLVKKKVDSTF